MIRNDLGGFGHPGCDPRRKIILDQSSGQGCRLAPVRFSFSSPVRCEAPLYKSFGRSTDTLSSQADQYVNSLMRLYPEDRRLHTPAPQRNIN